jgi:hypothetical protein
VFIPSRLALFTIFTSAGFTYRLDRLKPRASIIRGPPVKVCNFFNIVFGLFFNKGENDERCLKFCNIHKWGATVKGKLLNGCLESTVRYDSKGVKVQ